MTQEKGNCFPGGTNFKGVEAVRIGLLLAIVLAALIMAANHFSYLDEVAEERHYCQMVKEGAWPAFKDDVVCP